MLLDIPMPHHLQHFGWPSLDYPPNLHTTFPRSSGRRGSEGAAVEVASWLARASSKGPADREKTEPDAKEDCKGRSGRGGGGGGGEGGRCHAREVAIRAEGQTARLGCTMKRVFGKVTPPHERPLCHYSEPGIKDSFGTSSFVGRPLVP